MEERSGLYSSVSEDSTVPQFEDLLHHTVAKYSHTPGFSGTSQPICFDMIEGAYITKCDHGFCYQCIHQSLEDNNRCPKCNYVVDNIDHLYPNFLVNELILKQKQRSEEKRFKLDHSLSSTSGYRWQIFHDFLVVLLSRYVLPPIFP